MNADSPGGFAASIFSHRSLGWLYLIAFTPIATAFLENGSWPSTPRNAFTEIAAALVLVGLVRYVRLRYHEALTAACNDPLTGLLNRRVFDDSFVDECVRARRTNQPLSLVYLDVDGFKQINDRCGHEAGDRALKIVAEAIGQSIRLQVDRGFRIGGDEFALLLVGSDVVQAEQVIARVCRLAAQRAEEEALMPLVLSAGTARLEVWESAFDLRRRADLAMYRQKHSSKPAGASIHERVRSAGRTETMPG